MRTVNLVASKFRGALCFGIASVACTAINANLNLGIVTAQSTTSTHQVAEQPQVTSSESTLDRFTRDVTFMADDALEGRDTYSRGAEITAQYMIDDFKKYGVKSAVPDGSYRQPFQVDMGVTLNQSTALLNFWSDQKSVPMTVDVDYKPQMVGGSGNVSGDLVFVGYGIDDAENSFQEYKDVDVEGKVVIILRRQPLFQTEGSPYSEQEVLESAYVRNKVAAAKQAGAVGIVFVNDVRTSPDVENDSLSNYTIFGDVDLALPFVMISQKSFNRLLATFPLKDAAGNEVPDIASVSKLIDQTGQPLSQAMGQVSAKYTSEFKEIQGWGYNVCAVIEGEGPLANETIVIGGHYDHLGIGGFGSRTPNRYGEIHNGADDNATGTAAVMELARRFAQAGKKPARRLVFIGFSDEERGLLGSYHYVQEPIYPLESTVAMVNFDMIGWLRNDSLTLYGTGTSDAWEPCTDKANADFGMKLDRIAAGFAGSDHLPFSEKGIPAVFVHTGLTPTYHTPEDDTDTLDLPNAVRVVDYSEALIEALLETDKIEFTNAQSRRPSRIAYLGAQLDFENIEESGLTIREVSPDSPAQKAGLQSGDIVSKMDDQDIRSREDIISFLRSKQPADKVNVVVIRDSQPVEIMVILGQSGR